MSLSTLLSNAPNCCCARAVLLGGISSLQNHCGRINNIELYALGARHFSEAYYDPAAVVNVLTVCPLCRRDP